MILRILGKNFIETTCDIKKYPLIGNQGVIFFIKGDTIERMYYYLIFNQDCSFLVCEYFFHLCI